MHLQYVCRFGFVKRTAYDKQSNTRLRYQRKYEGTTRSIHADKFALLSASCTSVQPAIVYKNVSLCSYAIIFIKYFVFVCHGTVPDNLLIEVCAYSSW